MKSGKIVMAVFTGTGNTLMLVKAFADALSLAGKDVAAVPMDRPELLRKHFVEGDFCLGLAVPLACFSTYPTAWRFIDSLPPGEGREAFFLASMGGMAGGMQGPIRRVLERKGYKPIGARIIKVSGNYGKGIPSAAAFDAIRAKSERSAVEYADDLLSRRAKWSFGNPASRLFAWMAHTRRPWNMFYRLFPLAVDRGKCTGCELCVRHCPERNIGMEDGKAAIGGKCQSCQRCVSLCPVGAIGVPGKTANRHLGVSRDMLMKLLAAGEDENAPEKPNAQMDPADSRQGRI